MARNTRIIIPEIERLSGETRHLYDVINEEPDLACVLIATSYLDYALGSLLKRYFTESSIVDKMLDPLQGTLSSFASRYDLAYCLGLIPKSLRQNLETIAQIRNKFAHRYIPPTLHDTEIAELVDKLIPPTIHERIILEEDGVKHEGPAPFDLAGTTPRDRFGIIAIFTLNNVLMIGLRTHHREVETRGWE